MKRSKLFLIIIFKNLIEFFRAKYDRQKIKRTLENAIEQLGTVIERLGMPKDAEGSWTLRNA